MKSFTSLHKEKPKRAKRGDTALSGVLLLDKPIGWTSHDLVNKLRQLTGEGRIGHCGTLDPDASGLMIMLIGHATKLSNDFLLENKSYRARIQFGSSTTTDDKTGECVQRSKVPAEVFDEVYAREVLKGFLGDSEQIPPDFSALKKGGKVAHKEARKGKSLEIEPRSITVQSARLVSIDKVSSAWIVDFDVSKGTYIRALARDIGEACGTHAHLSELRRTASGDFRIEDAFTIETICKAYYDESDAVPYPYDPNAITDYFVSREVLLDSISAERLISASLAGKRLGPSLVSIGVFDGVHSGHQTLLRAVAKRAKERGLLSTVLTFGDHPASVVRPLAAPKLLMPTEQKIEAIKACGIDEVLILPFNHKMSQQSAEDFLLQTLPTLVQVKEIMVGSNFRCGKNGSCDPQQMAKIFASANIGEIVSVVDLKTDKDGIPYSSTRLRKSNSD